ncbi:MAG: cupin domain-containing protein [Desulfobacterales bacterium]|nr:cupin domain-containing protein [Desulfobacterales bacterium]
MPFYRFEKLESKFMTPRLSTAHGPMIEGDFIYFCLVSKEPGAGSVVHYHPNELFIFPTVGKINSLVGRDRRMVPPGTFIHIPPYGRHQMTATEDGRLSYLYIKDKTWTVVGLAVDEAVPEKATSLEEANTEFQKSGWTLGKGEIKKEAGESSVRIDDLGNCYYPIIDAFDSPPASGNRFYRFRGDRMHFGFTELINPYEERHQESPHEQFIYVLSGTLDAVWEDEHEVLTAGGIMHIPKGSHYGISYIPKSPVRYVTVESAALLESAVG